MTFTKKNGGESAVMEIWKPVKGYEGRYEVSNQGRVREIRVLKIDGGGHVYSRVNIDGSTRYVHRLVAEAFLGDPPTPKSVVNHKDFNGRNNNVDNLEWVTQKENTQHASVRMRKPRKAFKTSNTGHKYISFDGRYFRLRIKQVKVYKSFKTLKECVDYKNEVLSTWGENAFFAEEQHF